MFTRRVCTEGESPRLPRDQTNLLFENCCWLLELFQKNMPCLCRFQDRLRLLPRLRTALQEHPSVLTPLIYNSASCCGPTRVVAGGGGFLSSTGWPHFQEVCETGANTGPVAVCTPLSALSVRTWHTQALALAWCCGGLRRGAPGPARPRSPRGL